MKRVFFWALLCVSLVSFGADDVRNLLLNGGFAFHTFEPHRSGGRSYSTAGSIPGWNVEKYGDVQAVFDTCIPAGEHPAGSGGVGVTIQPGKSLRQFFLLHEAGLSHGDAVSLQFQGYQSKPNALHGAVRAMKIDAEPGKWKPSDFGFGDSREFSKIARGELVVAAEQDASSPETGVSLFKVENFVIPGKFSNSPVALEDDVYTIGLEVVFTNTSDAPVRVFNPSLVRGAVATAAIGEYRALPQYYRHIPRFMQKLWRGEPVHILVMGSSIDRASSNPFLYAYNEDPNSPDFKKPIMDCYGEFHPAKLGREDLEDHFAQGRYYFSCYGWLKRYLMSQFNLPADKILLNFMASDGSCVGESHTCLLEYANLEFAPDPMDNGHRKGKSWKELYPALFERPEGPGPDLVIDGSGANENTDGLNQIAVYEGAIRFLRRHFPNVEFLFCQYPLVSSDTGDLQALSLRYQIPMIPLHQTLTRLRSYTNPYALVPQGDVHPQMAVHYIWYKQMEQAFFAAEPILPGIAQPSYTERMHINTFGWEGDNHLVSSPHPKRFILDDTVFNVWASINTNAQDKPQPGEPGGIQHHDPPPVTFTPSKQFSIYVDGKRVGSVWRPAHPRSQANNSLRNSFFRYGNLSLGDRHVVEMDANAPFAFTEIDMKIPLIRHVYPVESFFHFVSPLISQGMGGSGEEPPHPTFLPVEGPLGSPYGDKGFLLQPEESVSINNVLASMVAPAWLDRPDGGKLIVSISEIDQTNGMTANEKKTVTFETNQPYTFVDGEQAFLPNRRAIPLGKNTWHTITLTAKDSPVFIIALFSYNLSL